MRPTTTALLRHAGVSRGQRCIDIGCGGGHVSQELARRVGSDGSVVGVDLDETVLELARADAQAAGLHNVEFRVGKAQQIDGGPYDVAYARFLLSHVEEPLSVVRATAEAVNPGGTVIVEDIDFSGSFCSPPCPAYQRYVDLYRETVRRRGGNADIGPLLPSILQAAGLRNVAVAVVQPCGLEGDAKLVSPLTLARIANSVVAEGVTTTNEVNQTISALYAYHADPTTIMSLPAWCKPGPVADRVRLRACFTMRRRRAGASRRSRSRGA